MIRQVTGDSIICMRKWPRVPYAVGDRVDIVAEYSVPRGDAHVQRLRSLLNNFLSSINTTWVQIDIRKG
jgi:hypothetical protein